MNISHIDRKLVDLLQLEFPLTSRPYFDIGQGLAISEEEVIGHIRRLKEAGIIRQISPVLAAGSLGYRTALIAMRIPERQMDDAARFIIEHPRISHGYERDHHFNLWFTLTTTGEGGVDAELPDLAEKMSAEAFFPLPAVRLFKLRTHFSMGAEDNIEVPESNDTLVCHRETCITPQDRIVIQELQQDLPLLPRPFTGMALRLGMEEEDLLSRCRSLIERGIMRRFGAAVNHRKAGFQANAMTCWIAPPGRIEIVGKQVASQRQVSHCYERKTNPLWPYNLFAMIHGRDAKVCREVADKITAETGLRESVMLISTREFKKTRVKYLA